MNSQHENNKQKNLHSSSTNNNKFHPFRSFRPQQQDRLYQEADDVSMGRKERNENASEHLKTFPAGPQMSHHQ